MLSLPSKFLQQHGGKIRDGLIVLKLVAGLGKIAGLPLNLEGMPIEAVSMAQGLGRRSGLQFDLAAPSPRVPTPTPQPHHACRYAGCLHENGMGGRSLHVTLYTNRRRLKPSRCSKSCSTAPPRPRRLSPRKARVPRPQSLASAQSPRARVLQQLQARLTAR